MTRPDPTYIPADEDDAAWLPAEDAMQAFQIVEDEKAPSPEEDGAAGSDPTRTRNTVQSTTRVDLVHFLESLSQPPPAP